MLTSDFLRRVLPPAGDGWYCWATPAPVNDKGRRFNQRFTRYLSHVVDGTSQCDAAHINTYYAMSSFRERGTRAQENVAYVKSFWIDIDCGADKAAAGKGYPTQVAACAALLTATKTLKLPRPMLVNSGNGIHAYWPLAEAIPPDVWRPIACQLVAAYQEQGLVADWGCSADHSRILRPVGTHNWKDPSNPKPVTLLADCPDYGLAAIATPVEHYVVAVPASRYGDLGINSDLGLPQEPPSSVPDVVADHCAQVALFRDTRGCLPEPQWRAGIAVIKACIDGEETVHEWSKGYEGYSVSETDLKIAQTKGPTTCAAFERLDPVRCNGCKFKGTITSPIQLGKPEPEEVTEEVVDEEVTPEAPPEPVTDKVPPLPDSMARSYRWTKDGMCSLAKAPVAEGSSEEHWVWVPFTDAYIRVVEHSWLAGASHMRLQVRRKTARGIKTLDMPSSLVHDKQGMLKWLADHGLGPYYGKDAEMIAYMKRWFDETRQRVEETRQHLHYGWQEDGGFLIGDRLYRTGKDARKVSVGGDASVFLPAFAQRGTLQDWTESINAIYGVKGMEAYQFIIAAGFGSVLMGMLDQAGVVVGMISTESGVGKTTVAKAAMSIWGDPDKLATTYQQSTGNALIGRMGVLHDMPCYVDEITTASPRELMKLAYDVTGGQSKARASRSGDLKAPKSSWNQLVIVSGNASVWQKIGMTMAKAEGPLVRVLEYRLTKHFKSTEDSRELFAKLANSYGTAGDAFIRFVVDNADDVAKLVTKIQNQIAKRAAMQDNERYWRDGVTAALAGVSIAQQLGLVNFNIPALVDWSVRRIVESRNEIAGVRQADSDAFGKMMNDLAGGIIATDKIGSEAEPAFVQRRPNGAVYGRQIGDEGKLYLTTSAVRGWCKDNNADFKEMTEDATARGIIMGTEVFRLGVGTDVPTGTEKCIIIKVTDDTGDQ